jgi:hypothetical protein
MKGDRAFGRLIGTDPCSAGRIARPVGALATMRGARPPVPRELAGERCSQGRLGLSRLRRKRT